MTSIRPSKKIKAFLYRIIAAGALFTMIFSGIMGREALNNLNRMGSGALDGKVYHLVAFREYIINLYLDAMIGYVGIGDDNGFPLTDSNATELSQQSIKDFHTSVKDTKKDLLYHIEKDGELLESNNISYPLFSEYDGHLLLPDDVTLCLYWDGPSNTLYFFGTEYSMASPSYLLDLYSDQQYRFNTENVSDIRLLLAVRNETSFTSKGMCDLNKLAKDYQRVLITFFTSVALFLLSGIFCLFSRKTAREMWQDFAAHSLKLWMECKLLIASVSLYVCYYYWLFNLTSSADIRLAASRQFWLYFPTGILLYLFYRDLRCNQSNAWKHSLAGGLLRFLREYVSGLKWYRKAMLLCAITFCSSLMLITAGILLLYILSAGYFAHAADEILTLAGGGLSCIAGVLLFFVSIHWRRFLTDTNRISTKLGDLRAGTDHSPIVLSDKSLLCQAADDLNALENGIEAAVEQQNRSNKMRVELITNVSHDLKTPLTSIINYADLLCEEDLAAPASEYAVALQSKAYRLESMVQDVFELSKATSGNLPVEKTVLDLAKLIKQTLADMDERIMDSTLTFKLAITTEPILIEADGEKLYRIFQNLIVNALQYSLENSRVYIQLTTENGFAYARVKNTSRQELDFDPEEIVERFVRADSSRTTEGSGLGLSIVQSFTEACGGSFRITTDADMFTACVSFPLADSPLPPMKEGSI